MNTTTTTSPAVLATRRAADAAEAMLPYLLDGTFKDAPPAQADEFAAAIMDAMPIWQEAETLNVDLAQALFAWAQDYIERRDYPEFFTSLSELGRILDTQGKEALHTPENSPLFVKLYRSAPPRYKAGADAILEEALPAATHVDDQGQPVYSVQQIADKFDRTVEQVEADIQRMSDMGISDFQYPGPVHPIQ